ncbi:MAG TPA: ankyrin repeat domain-containing protein [Mucilaginibacter sp.]
MNKFITAIKELNLRKIEEILKKEPQWFSWKEDNGKNALHYLGGVAISKFPEKAEASLDILKLLLKGGMNSNSIHSIPDGCGFFPATPLWYAYTRGRNELLYKHLLAHGANPDHCMYAIAWYDDTEAAGLFKKYGASINGGTATDTPFLGAFNWKRYNVAEWFLANGADVNFADDKGNTALYYAVKRKLHAEQIQLLLKYGADFDIRNKEGISPKILAETNRQKKILSLFVNRK